MPDFGPLWRPAPNDTIEYAGRRLQQAYSVGVAKDDMLHILFERFTSRPVQGLGLKLKDPTGALEIGTIRSRNVALWTDTAPRHVECSVVKAQKGAQLSVMNQWRDEEFGTTMGGLNAAAIDVRNEPDGSILLQCSDGWGAEAHFDDLVVRLIFERSTS